MEEKNKRERERKKQLAEEWELVKRKKGKRNTPGVQVEQEEVMEEDGHVSGNEDFQSPEDTSEDEDSQGTGEVPEQVDSEHLQGDPPLGEHLQVRVVPVLSPFPTSPLHPRWRCGSWGAQ